MIDRRGTQASAGPAAIVADLRQLLWQSAMRFNRRPGFAAHSPPASQIELLAVPNSVDERQSLHQRLPVRWQNRLVFRLRPDAARNPYLGEVDAVSANSA